MSDNSKVYFSLRGEFQFTLENTFKHHHITAAIWTD